MKAGSLLILLVACYFNSFSQNLNSNQFSITGKYIGTKITEISCSYRDELDNWITQDCDIINGRFSINGGLTGPSAMVLSSKLATGTDDPNFVEILIEPGNIEVALKENEFKTIKVKGSSIQQKYNLLEKSKVPINSRLQAVYSLLNPLDDSLRYLHAINDTNRLNQLLKTRELILAQTAPFRDSLNQLEMRFVADYPNEFLSAYLLQRQYSVFRLNKDSAKFYCNNFSAAVQNSYWTKSILKDITKKEGSAIGAIAKDFTVKDKDGLDFSFSPAKSKNYVLIDFWASWCVPCREATPHLKLSYEKYKARGLIIMAISHDRDKEAWLKAIQTDDIENWKNARSISTQDDVFDETDIGKKYEMLPIPMIYLINNEGVIVGKWLGSGDENEKEIDKKLEEIFGF